MILRSFLIFAFCAFFSVHARDRITLDDLRLALAQHLSQERFASATWGVKVVSLETGAVLIETNAQKLLKPASNAKLYTGALALDRLGPNYRIRTSVLADDVPRDGTIEGDLVIYGRGDPSFSARFHDGSYSNLFGTLVGEIKRAGVRSVRGDLVGDDTHFSGPRAGAGWTWDDLNYYYGAEASALSVQDNVVDLFIRPGKEIGAPCVLRLRPASDYLEFVSLPRTGAKTDPTGVTVFRPLGSREVYLRGTIAITNSGVVDAVTVPDPALWFVTMLREALAKEGIQVHGRTRTVSWPNAAKHPARELAYVESRPMTELVEKMMKPSQNLYAQLLLLHVGTGAKGGDALTERKGIAALREFLRGIGIDPREVLLEEGSGLSRGCLVTPKATIELLEAMARHEHASYFHDSLPEPGEGTLRRRLLELRGRLRAKTGTLRYVNSLSGYVRTEAGERLAFAVMLNAFDPAPGGASGRDEIDVIPRLLAKLGERTAAD